MSHADDLLRAAEIVSASAAGLPKSLGGDNEALAARLRAAKPDLFAAYKEHYEASEAFRILPWYKDGRNEAEREAAATRLDEAIYRIRALEAEQSKEQT